MPGLDVCTVNMACFIVNDHDTQGRSDTHGEVVPDISTDLTTFSNM